MKNVKLLDISNYVEQPDKIYAHKSEEGGKETLIEHMEATIGFFYDLLDKKKLDKVLNNLIEGISVEGKPLNPEYSDLIKELFVNAIYLHDIGKINYSFQKKKMENDELPDIKNIDTRYTDHSLLSGLIYIDIYTSKVMAIESRAIACFMHFILYTFAYIISRHHTHLNNLEGFLDNLSDLLEKRIKRNPECLYYYKSKTIFQKSLEEDIFESRNGYLKKFLKYYEIDYYILNKLLFSILTGCDFYATYYYANKTAVDYGIIENKGKLTAVYENSDICRGIRAYKNDKYYFESNSINSMRSEMFLEAEENILKNMENNMFYLEAPTGSGKTNTSVNLALKILENSPGHNKIFYIFPFNTLVDQTKKALDKALNYNENQNVRVAVINSITPILTDEEGKDNENHNDYEKYLINRQFLHYPVVLTTHVNFFNYLFGTGREAGFPLIHLCNSVVIIDEIQSYRNSIWMEIILFLEKYGKLLNMKVIIMSATLPKLDELIKIKSAGFVELIKDKRKYYDNELFRNRVVLNFDLLELGRITVEQFIEKAVEITQKHGSKRILIEFIKKSTARKIYNALKVALPEKQIVELTGDDNILNRDRILGVINKRDKNEDFVCKDIIVVATQVIEAGVDIDMDIGMKDISMLDNEEQFLGRINRSCSRVGCTAYFFDMDNAEGIYKRDVRLEKNLHDKEYRDYLENKDFEEFYKLCFRRIDDKKSECNSNNIGDMINDVLALDFGHIEERMRLIDSKQCRLFLAYELYKDEGERIVGLEVWEEYKRLVYDNDMKYARKIVELSHIYEKMSYFLYNYSSLERCSKYNAGIKPPPIHDGSVGDIFLVKNGRKYITKDGKFDREKYSKESESDFL